MCVCVCVCICLSVCLCKCVSVYVRLYVGDGTSSITVITITLRGAQRVRSFVLCSERWYFNLLISFNEGTVNWFVMVWQNWRGLFCWRHFSRRPMQLMEVDMQGRRWKQGEDNSTGEEYIWIREEGRESCWVRSMAMPTKRKIIDNDSLLIYYFFFFFSYFIGAGNFPYISCWRESRSLNIEFWEDKVEFHDNEETLNDVGGSRKRISDRDTERYKAIKENVLFLIFFVLL